MSTAVTQGITVTAQPRFEAEHSDVKALRHVFSYRITIRNDSSHTVKLLRRHWHIVDTLADRHEVEGPGVVGQTPVLDPGERYAYSSHCMLRGAFGRMWGTFLMERSDGLRFEVIIPAFDLVSPLASN
jgi:ApaG protein